jgi:restriction endonuclease S subunit
LGELPVALPPLPEQRAIAAALSDVDALLGGLDRLIAKKRDLKQATMQQLLTGETRLPGFHDKWERGILGSVIGALDAGVSVNSVEDDDGDGFDGMFILRTSAVAGGRFIPRECKRIARKDLSRACLNPLKGTIIISRMNTPELVGECGYVDRDYPTLFVPDRLWMTRFKQDLHVSGLWLSYLLSTATLKRQIAAAATGTSGSMKNLSKQTFLQIPIALPSGREQSAIAAVLSDMDTELSALEARRDKTRALKQGMMQELLTGKTRLVSTGGAHA